MKRWTRAQVDQLCGLCGKAIEFGAPLLQIQIAGMRRAFLRCQGCAGEAVPDLPLRIETAPLRPKVAIPVRIGSVTLPRDFKVAQGGREPGDDDA